jgi:hypothetical protein
MNEILLNMIILYLILWIVFAVCMLMDYISDKLFAYPYDIKIRMIVLNLSIVILLSQLFFTFLIIFYYLLLNIDLNLALAGIFSIITFLIILGFLEGFKKNEQS